VHLVINWTFPDLAERYLLNLENCALTYLADRTADHADVTVTLARPVLSQWVLQRLILADAIHTGAIALEGDAGKLSELFELFDEFPFMFHILEPRHER
jgi:alkyl sulfatase BDS1-like metallo-beta-lactamase superfamily hydrolase